MLTHQQLKEKALKDQKVLAEYKCLEEEFVSLDHFLKQREDFDRNKFPAQGKAEETDS